MKCKWHVAWQRDIQSDTSTYIDLHRTVWMLECSLGEPCKDGKFTISSSLQSLKELAKGAHEDTTSCTMQANTMTILLGKLLVFSNATSSKTVTLWV